MAPASGSEQLIALVSMPWPILNRPSIQLGALKAYVEQHTSCRVATFHPYLELAAALGTETYGSIADNSWAGESLFAALLFPEQEQAARHNFLECLSRKARHLPDFGALLTIIDKTCAAWLNTVAWQSFRLAGFSLCFNQLLSSLYLASRLKERPESPPIVFGGSSCAGELGKSLFSQFPQIDYLIDGEGETPLAGLCNYLAGASVCFPERVLARHIPSDTQPSPEIDDLNSLPVPDYTPYFQQMKTVFSETAFIPVLPLEFSRGCWWNKCTFCNLNLQWGCYRWKKSGTVLKELGQLTASHQCLDYTFTDNALPPREAAQFFAAAADLEADFRFFAEIRGGTDGSTLHRYRQGGLDTIQVGIEAFSNSLLAKMRKGVSVIDNIAMLKYALATDIRLEGNLIVEFPGSTPAEVEETLENLDYLLPFRPLAAATFFLGHGSAVDREPHAYNIAAVTQHRRNRRLFPPNRLRHLTLLIKDYRGDRRRQRALWQPVRKKIASWQEFHQRRTRPLPAALSYREGGDFLLIRQEMAAGPPLRHRLQGLSRAIYLFCGEIRTVQSIIMHFDSLKESAILAFIHQLCQKRLMYRDQERVLSLAIRQE